MAGVPPSHPAGMGREPLEAGPLVVALGALVMLVSLFIDWFDPGGSAWTVFEIIDLLLAALSLAALVLVGERLGLLPRRLVPGISLMLIGAAALVLVASQLINHPPGAQDHDLDVGAWLALAGTVIMFLGGLLSRVRVSLAMRPPAEPAAASHQPAPPAPAGAAPTTPGQPSPHYGQPPGAVQPPPPPRRR